ncbi:MAG: iron-sulfur cluster assembly accessory protein [Candidatus Methylomirabilis oxyfera]|nr:iron-sulfur cluster assembly accessory protein [Candidatus Methylomirabilis oxyfera]
MITFSESARKKILALIEAERQQGLALRVAIKGRGPGGFNYEFGFAGEEDKRDTDVVVDAGGFNVLIDPESAPNLKDTTIDYLDGVHESGFKIDNPNLWADPRAKAVQQVIDTQINPAVSGHGGHVTLLDVKDDTAYIALGGGCQGCGMADVTLKHGIEAMIKESVPEIRQIIDTTDHAGGTNPYYQPSKGGGHSPFE